MSRKSTTLKVTVRERLTASHQAKDKVLKTLADYYAKPLAKLVFPKQKFKIIAVKLDKELMIRTRLVDKVFKLRLAKKEYLLHLEFLTQYKAQMARDIFVYSAGLTNNYGLKTISVLFLIKPRSKKRVSLGRYVVDPNDVETNAFTFPIICLWEFREAILAGEQKYLGLVPLLLEMIPKPNVNLLMKVHELAKLERNHQRQKVILASAAVLATRYFVNRTINTILLKDIDMTIKQVVKEFPGLAETYRELEQEAKSVGWELGHKEGHEEGALLTSQKFFSDLIKERLGALDKRTWAAIRSIKDARTLQTFYKRARRLKSEEAFREVVKSLAIAAKPNGRHNGRHKTVRSH